MNELLTAEVRELENIRHYIEKSLSENTRKAYRSDIEHFIKWGGIIPSSSEQVAAYLSTHAERLSIATLQRRLVSIAKAHNMQGFADPAKTDLVRLTMRGIRRVHGKPQREAAPVLKDDLIVMLSHVPDSIKGKRDAALLLLGFCGAFRRSELVALKCTDLEFTNQGIIVTLPRSKTDQFGAGRKIGIPKGRGKICAVEAVHAWFLHLSALSGPLFRSISKGGILSDTPLSDRAVAEIIKYYGAKAGLNFERLSGHSLRSGLATSAAQLGISSWKIRQQTGHRSDAMLARYIRDGDLFADNAAALF